MTKQSQGLGAEDKLVHGISSEIVCETWLEGALCKQNVCVHQYSGGVCFTRSIPESED